MDTGTTDAVESSVVGDTLGNPGGARRSTREHKQVMNLQPAMQGKKYVFAAMALVTTQWENRFSVMTATSMMLM